MDPADQEHASPEQLEELQYQKDLEEVRLFFREKAEQWWKYIKNLFLRPEESLAGAILATAISILILLVAAKIINL